MRLSKQQLETNGVKSKLAPKLELRFGSTAEGGGQNYQEKNKTKLASCNEKN